MSQGPKRKMVKLPWINPFIKYYIWNELQIIRQNKDLRMYKLKTYYGQEGEIYSVNLIYGFFV